MKLIAPESYWQATPEERAAVVNGCGPGSWKLNLIPNNLLGADIREACNIHDWMFAEGKDFEESNQTFLVNMVICCAMAPELHLLGARLAEAAIFYAAVEECGRRYFGAQQ